MEVFFNLFENLYAKTFPFSYGFFFQLSFCLFSFAGPREGFWAVFESFFSSITEFCFPPRV